MSHVVMLLRVPLLHRTLQRNYRLSFASKHCTTYAALLQTQLRHAHAHRTNYGMDKVYLRNAAESEELHISFRYANESLRVNREFNFCRNMHENVDITLARIRTNIEKELSKRNKKGKKLSPAEVPTTDVAVDVELLRAGSDIKITDVTFADLLNGVSTGLQMRVLERRFEVVLNHPWVANLVMPTSILAGFVVFPQKVELQFGEQKHSRAIWYKAKKPPSGDLQNAAWQKCVEGFFYTTTNDDIDHHLKLVLTPGNAAGFYGPPVEHISKSAVQAGPGVCPFETRHCFTPCRLSGDLFRVVSYNILADLYADSDYSRTYLFPYCAPYALKMDYRKQLFLKEIVGYNADIICLQEVDMKIFDFELTTVLGAPEQGYRGLIAQKGTSGEGVAVFYRTDRFEFINSFEVNIGDNIKTLPQFSKLWAQIRPNKKLAERICARSTTLQLVLLKCVETQRWLLMANTHLYFHPDADHIRLLQIGFCMLYVEHIFKKTLEDYHIKDEKQLAVVFCGDFNSVPECGIYKLMTEGYVGKDFQDWNSNEEQAVKNVALSQPFNMQSACGTPQYTNYTHLFAACLDYIFYQSDRLEVHQVVPLPTEEELKTHVAIPSVVFPSDHVALVADIKFKVL